MSKDDDKGKKFFKVDISDFDDMQDLIFQYFVIMQQLFDDRKISIEKIAFTLDSNEVFVEGTEATDEDSEDESTEWDCEWI